MKKAYATFILGDSPTAAAKAMGISSQAYSQWPDDLPSRLEDRVIAAYFRQRYPDVIRLLRDSTPSALTATTTGYKPSEVEHVELEGRAGHV